MALAGVAGRKGGGGGWAGEKEEGCEREGEGDEGEEGLTTEELVVGKLWWAAEETRSRTPTFHAHDR